MTDPVSITVLALVQLLMSAAKGAANAAGRDAYEALKRALFAQYPEVQSVLENLERNPESLDIQHQLIVILRGRDAGNDSNLQRLTMNLRNVLKHLSQANVVIDQKRASGYNTIQQSLDAHLNLLIGLRKQFRVKDSGLLSSSVSRAAEIPQQYRAEVRALHGRIRHYIESVARMIEDGNYRDTDAFISRLPALIMQERAATLIKADRDLHVSYQTLRLSVDYFSKFNSMLLARIDPQGPPNQESDLLFGNSILVYELADYLIGFIQDFIPGGIRDLEELHKAALSRIEETRADLQRLVDTAESGRIDPKLRDSRVKTAHERERALDLLQAEWESYISEAKQFYARVDDARGLIPNLEFIREDARIQIDMLEQFSIFRVLRESLKSVQGTVDALAQFPLAPLNESRVRRLLEVA
jgi:hypothetical protein